MIAGNQKPPFLNKLRKYNHHNKMGCGASTSNNPNDVEVSRPDATARYLRQELLGKGTYGAVHKCIDTKDNKVYAMKVIKINSKTREGAAKEIGQLKSQITMLKKLNHPFIVKYQNFDVTPTLDEVEIVMELVQTGTLRQYIEKNGPLPEKACAEVCAKILEALVYLHGQKIIHRDLKCANILLTENLIPKLSDFGTAKIIPHTDSDDIARLSASLKGTPFYMAPQVLKRTGHNHSADIWSFGCMTIQMLSGKVPWTNHTAKFSQIIGYISSGIHPPFPPNLTKQCTFFLQACLDPIATKRLDASELLKHRFIDRNSVKSGNIGNIGNEKNVTTNSSSLSKPNSGHKKVASRESKQSKKELLNQGSRNTLYDISAVDVEDIEDQDMDQQYYSQRKNTQSYSRSNFSPYESNVKEKMSHRRKISQKQPMKKGVSKIISQIDELDRLEAEINEVSVDEEEIPKDRYYVKKTMTNLKKSRQSKSKGISKTSTALKNTEDNILSIDNSYSELQMRSNTEMTHEEQAINTMISRAERDRYIEQQKIFQKLRNNEKKKWEEELKEGAEMLKKQFSNRYILPKV